MPSKIVEIGFGRYLSRFLTLLGFNTYIKIKIIKYLKIIIYFKVWIKSKNIKNYINNNNKLSIPKDSKSLKFPKNTLIGMNNLISHCRKIYSDQKENLKVSYVPPYKPLIGFFEKGSISDDQKNMIKPILKFASQPLLMNTIADYLKSIPTIVTVNLLYSEAMKKYQKVSNAQRYHSDMLDPSLLHLIIPINDIKEETGPFTFIDVKTSKKIIKEIKHQTGRIDDDLIMKYAKQENINKLVGKAGDAWIMSPFHSIHMGSRVEKGFRLMLIISYASPLHAIEHVNYFHREKVQNKLIDEFTSKNEKELLRIYS